MHPHIKGIARRGIGIKGNTLEDTHMLGDILDVGDVDRTEEVAGSVLSLALRRLEHHIAAVDLHPEMLNGQADLCRQRTGDVLS